MAKILIVDDSIVMRKNLKSILRSEGHEIVGEAVNGKQAVSMYFELKPDLVTMDISMPIMQGVDALKEIIKQDKSAKIVIISALNQKHMVFDALKNGAKHYIIKPIDSERMVSIIDETLLMENVVTKSENNSSLSKETISDEKEGFMIGNENGVFIIKLNEHFNLKDQISIDTAIKGLLFIKPLKVKIDFSDAQHLTEELVMPIHRICKQIKEAKGEITLGVNNERLSEIINKWEL